MRLLANHRRRSHDLFKTIVLFCILALVSLTVQTLPHVQRMLDGTCCTSDFPILGTRKRQTIQDFESTSNATTFCWKHEPVNASSFRVADKDSHLEQPTTKRLWEAP